MLTANGFAYDSSVEAAWGPSTFSPSAAYRVWPFTMDYGFPIDCTASSGNCSVSERHPGLWEFPLWDVQADDGSVVASMDPEGNITGRCWCWCRAFAAVKWR